jgi:hypothetical protein
VPSARPAGNADAFSNGSPGAAPAAAPAVNFANAFNSADNPCFHGDSRVRLADGSSCKVSLLEKGHVVAVAGASRPGEPASMAAGEAGAAPAEARVLCVIRTDCEGGLEEMVSLNGGALVITPWHPVWHGGRWRFPADLAPACPTSCPAVYSVLMEGGHSIEVGGLRCVTLGHGIAGDAVATHEYLGAVQVTKDLERLPGFADGSLHFRPGCMVRGKNGRVCGFKADRLIPPHVG